MELKARFLDINRKRLVVSNRRSRKPGFLRWNLSSLIKILQTQLPALGRTKQWSERSCLMKFPSDPVCLSFLLRCWCIWWEHQQVGGKNLTGSCIKLWRFSRTWLICLEEMNPWQGLHHWAALNDAQDEILAPVELMEVLPLISVRPGFHPGKGGKSTCMLSETKWLIKYIWCTVLLSIIDKTVSFKYKLWVSLTTKFKHVLLQDLKG